MTRYAPAIFVVLAVLVSVATFYGEDNLVRLKSLRAALDDQRVRNFELRSSVQGLRAEIVGLETSGRALEEAARRDLKMVRPDESIIIFSDSF